jgi:antitoxin component YwqK of YwqJK toxin-antitoxin module
VTLRSLRRLVLVSVALVVSGCSASKLVVAYFVDDPCQGLASIYIVDHNGISETVSNPDRLEQYATVDFLSCQPYQKVLRVWRRNADGNIPASTIAYHPNGQPKQYLEVVNGRALGTYKEWYSNGQQKVLATVIGGHGDIYAGAENSWLFDGNAYAWNEQGVLLATIPYSKGKLEGLSLYYHASGSLWRQVPMHAGLIDGVEEVFFSNGALFQTATYREGLREGSTKRYWENGCVAVDETYANDKLLEGLYTAEDGSVVSTVHKGEGFRAEFGKHTLKELQRYVNGIQEGLVEFYDKQGNLLRTCNYKNGIKEGEEIEYYPRSKQPQLSIQWDKGKIHGPVKSWYPDGTAESQREMAGNMKMGLLMTWYGDGSLMLAEEYDQDKLVRGEYYEKGSSQPISRVDDGKGLAIFHTADGRFLRKVKYRLGLPEIDK